MASGCPIRQHKSRPSLLKAGLSSGVLVLLGGDLNSCQKTFHTNTTYKDIMLGGPAPSKPSAEPWGARAWWVQSVGKATGRA